MKTVPTRFVVSAAAIAATFALVGLSGCSSSGSCARCGWRFEIIKPPMVETHGAVLVHQGAPLMGAMPVGHLSGPIAEPVPVQLRQLPAPRMVLPCEPAPRAAAPCPELPVPREAPRKGAAATCPDGAD